MQHSNAKLTPAGRRRLVSLVLDDGLSLALAAAGKASALLAGKSSPACDSPPTTGETTPARLPRGRQSREPRGRGFRVIHPASFWAVR